MLWLFSQASRYTPDTLTVKKTQTFNRLTNSMAYRQELWVRTRVRSFFTAQFLPNRAFAETNGREPSEYIALDGSTRAVSVKNTTARKPLAPPSKLDAL